MEKGKRKMARSMKELLSQCSMFDGHYSNRDAENDLLKARALKARRQT
jgi:hypothetical protein